MDSEMLEELIQLKASTKVTLSRIADDLFEVKMITANREILSLEETMEEGHKVGAPPFHKSAPNLTVGETISYVIDGFEEVSPDDLEPGDPRKAFDPEWKNE